MEILSHSFFVFQGKELQEYLTPVTNNLLRK